MKRLTLLLASFAALLFLGAGCFTTTVTRNSNATRANANVAEFVVPLTIQKGEGSRNDYRLTVESGTTALRLLENAAAENNFTIQTKTYDFGVLVEGIDGTTADSDHFWSFYVNSEPATVGAGAYTLTDGDSVEFRYERLEVGFRFLGGLI